MPTLARKKPAPWTVEKIKTSQIVNRLHNHILAKNKDDPAHMTQSQVTAALGLLKKVHPDLAAAKVDLSGAVTVEVLRVESHPPPPHDADTPAK
jgi:two-component SAPR family response regulator